MIDECTIIIDINYTGSQEQVVGNDTHTEEFNDFSLLCKLFSICLFINLLICPFSKFLVKKPSKQNVLEQLAPIDTSWRSIGNGFGVEYNVLQGLAESNMSNQTRLDHVLQKWIDLDDQESPVIWKTIIDVVKGPLVQNKALAKEIYQYLKQLNATSKYNVFSCYYNSLMSEVGGFNVHPQLLHNVPFFH